ncbi:MAG: hypothetical protein JNK66_10915 [Chitinophagales bacterium]|nr:hypothetical protein [Chitinophagales bacterium]
MLRIVYVVAILGLFSSCAKEQSGKVKIKFVNSGTTDFNELRIENRMVGDLQVGKTSKVIRFDEFTFDESTPVADITCYSGSDLIQFSGRSFCSTMYETVLSGNYIFYIKDRKNASGKKYITIDVQKN